jgi:hypothetical protein
MNKITDEMILAFAEKHLVFAISADGKTIELLDVNCDVAGDIRGTVCGDLHHSVRGDIYGNVDGHIYGWEKK